MTESSPTPGAAGSGATGSRAAGSGATGSRATGSRATGSGATGPRRALARYWWVAGLAIAGAIAVLAAFFASGDPDGLDRVAIDKGFGDVAQDPGFEILPGYSIPGLDGAASTIVAGIVGIVVIFLLMLLLGRLLARRRKDPAA
ncbi:MAG: PDGLE domain-containing protein [Chloroflexota bacterium]